MLLSKQIFLDFVSKTCAKKGKSVFKIGNHMIFFRKGLEIFSFCIVIKKFETKRRANYAAYKPGTKKGQSKENQGHAGTKHGQTGIKQDRAGQDKTKQALAGNLSVCFCLFLFDSLWFCPFIHISVCASLYAAFCFCLFVSNHVCPILSVSVNFSSLMPTSVCFFRFMTVSVNFSPLLSNSVLSVHFSPFMSIFVLYCLLLSISVCFCYFCEILSVSVSFCLFLPKFVLNKTAIVLNMTRFVLNMTGFEFFVTHLGPAQPDILVQFIQCQHPYI